MPYKDLHSSPFSISTITKLEIFEDYAEAWFPTFIMQDAIKEIHVFDFFAGPGYDINGTMGSPIRLLLKVRQYIDQIAKTNTKVVLHLNECEPKKVKQEKFELLHKNCDEFLNNHSNFNGHVSIQLYNEDAATLFFKLLPQIKTHPSLLYLDQNGVKFISQEFITELEKLTMVDFLYFVSSSYFWRLGHTEEFQRVLPIDMNILKRGRYTDVHRIVSAALKNTLPVNSQLKLFPFSIKKEPNIYGIIFGSKHYLAVSKFLEIAWKRNETNGEADFDIDGEIVKGPVQGNLFMDFTPSKLTKVDAFKADIKQLILSGDLKDNKDALHYTYESGHLPMHAADAIKELKNSGKIKYDGRTPSLTYSSVHREKTIIKYEVNGTVKY